MSSEDGQIIAGATENEEEKRMIHNKAGIERTYTAASQRHYSSSFGTLLVNLEIGKKVIMADVDVTSLV